jgi:hypothetical protein
MFLKLNLYLRNLVMDQSNTPGDSNTGLIPSPYAHANLNSKVNLYTKRAAEIGILVDNPQNTIESPYRPTMVVASGNDNNEPENETVNTTNNNGQQVDLVAMMAALVATQQATAQQLAALQAQANQPAKGKKAEGPFRPKEIDVYACRSKGTDGQLTDKLNGSAAIKLGPKSVISFAPEVWLDTVLKPFEDGTVREMVESVKKYIETNGKEGEKAEKWTL